MLSLISDDIRGATVYQKQDTKAIAQLMAAGTPFDVDSIDKAREIGGYGWGRQRRWLGKTPSHCE